MNVCVGTKSQTDFKHFVYNSDSLQCAHYMQYINTDDMSAQKKYIVDVKT